MAHQRIMWGNGFDKFRMWLIPSPHDGNCLYHSICNAFYKSYHTEYIDGIYVSRGTIVMKFRQELAAKLEEIDPNDYYGRTRYETLSNGNIKSLGDSGYIDLNHSYTLKGIQDWLNGTMSMGDEIIELIASVLQKSIYFLDVRSGDVYVMPEIPPDNQDCIVLLYNGSHYDLVGVMEDDNTMTTHFLSLHPFIKHIRRRLLSLKVQ